MRYLPIFVISLCLLVLTTVIPSAESAPSSRIIALTTDPSEKKNFKAEDCIIIHELIDATALDCPDNVSQKHISSGKAIRDEIFKIIDSDSNAKIGADKVWAAGYTGSGVTVAVLDTGVDYKHKELSSSTCGDISQPKTCGKSFVSYTSSFYDDHGHGTHVSGIITSDGLDAKSKGVAPDARVWMGKVCNSGGSCYVSDIAAGIEYIALNNVAKIMSISLGGGGTAGPNCNNDYLASKVNWAVTNYGVTAAIAAGNSGKVVSSPACASKAISVGAVDKSDVRPSWSGSGKALKIVAPGVGIYSTLPGDSYASWSGTSMATPHVSATIALMKQKNSALTDDQIKDGLYKNAKDLGATGWDRYYGWGRVDAFATVNAISAQ